MHYRAAGAFTGLIGSALCLLSATLAWGADETLPPRSEWHASASSASPQSMAPAMAIDGDGGTARSRSLFHNPNGMVVDGEPWLFVVGGYYHDRLVRLPAGWRIATRVEETLWWDHPMPGLPAVPYPLPDDALV